MTSLDERALAHCVRTASLAPSLHNSQPWRFRLVDGAVEVYADRRRQLEVLDPDGRELLISVGAAVFTLRLAIRVEGHVTEVSIFPDAGSPDLVARIRPAYARPSSAYATALAEAITARHTNRSPFADAVVPADSLAQLRAAATAEGATLTLADAVRRDVIINLAQAAEARLRAEGGYRAELGYWTRPHPHRRDGIPPTAVGPWDALEHLPMRDFGLVHHQPSRNAERFEAHPTITVLATNGDGPVDWVRAGQALQRVLLTATRLRLATTPISQPIEIPAIRDLLTDTGNGRSAQMVIRLGYAPSGPPTPRRPLTDILDTRTP
ncbi:nitroreductase family protein [Actinoplanes oblitus]|uniref:Nitroreductase family protein n=1 Tax=Actinoplanes oblitus TaxID=3040509 RepID=A0ABY8W5B3_9ACTN|nr:nitroreductase family protein [Actinoplanes oblitus]WIM93039.1 nitroreductase family protein [Actinoplanes oblitus]